MRVPILSLALLLTLALASSSALAEVVINEIDYDQPGTDTMEYLELYNNGPGAANLSEYTVELVNGSGGGAVVYQTIPLPSRSLAVGGFFVISANSVLVPNTDLLVTPSTNLIQNGSPDAIGLRHNDTLVDAVSYEGNSGAPYIEGTGTSAADDNVTDKLSIGRLPDGHDTDNNNADFVTLSRSPGLPNSTSPTSLPASGPLALGGLASGLLLLGGGVVFARARRARAA
jgi:hypothetical protein